MVARADLQVTLTAIDRATPTVKQLESSIIRFVGAVSATIAALGAITFPIAQATRFDRALRDVQKTTGFADDEIKQLGRDILDLSRNLDQSAQSLAGIAAAAGQLGLGRQGAEAILAFSESVARASTTLDLSTDAAARASAKLLNIFQLNTEQVENLFSTVNELSNTTTANAGELIDTMTRIGNTANLNAQEVSALAATAIDLGVSAEVAGTSLVKVFSRIQSNADKFADAIGISLEEFTALPALDRFQEFLSFLSKQTDEVQANLITKLAGGGRIFALVNKLTTDAGNGFAVLNRNLTTANTAFDSGLSAITEYANISKALQVQLGILRNNFNALTISVGQQFIPKLLEVTRDLTEFLQGPRAASFFRGVGESASDFLDVIIKMIRGVADLEINFRNLFAVLKAIIALQAARLFAGIAARLVQTVIAISGVGTAARVAQGPLGGLIRTFTQFTTAFGAATGFRAVASQISGVLVPAISSLGAAFLRVLPILGIVGLALGAVFLLFQDEITEAFSSLLGFFGFVSEEQGKILDDAKEELEADIVALEKASATISSARKKLASAELALPEESFAEILENDVTSLNDALLVAQERVKTLGELSTAAAEASAVFARAAGRFQIARREQIVTIADAQQELRDAQADLAELEALPQQEVQLEGVGGVASAQELADAAERIEEAQQGVTDALQRESDIRFIIQDRQQRSADLAAESLKNAEEQAELFFDIAGGLTRPLVQAFRLEIDARQVELQVADIGKELELLEGQLDAALELDPDNLDKQRELIGRIQELNRQFELLSPAAENARDVITRFAREGLSAAEQFTFAQALPNIAKTTEGLEVLENQFTQVNTAGLLTTEALDEAFAKNVESLINQRDELQRTADLQKLQKDELEDLAKAAKSVFDNTATEVRALNRALISSVEEFRIAVEGRPLKLKIETDIAELETALGVIEDRREELEKRLTEIEEEEKDNRLLGVFTFEKNKTRAELEELRVRQGLIEQQQRADQERRLRAEFALVEQRTRDFIQRAQELAGQGRLDEALGLKELAKQQIPELFTQLDELSGLTTGEGRPLVSTDQLETLVGQVQRLSQEVQDDIPGINETLKTFTEDALTDFAATATITTDALKEVTAELELMSKNIVGFAQVLPRLAARLAEGGGISGAQGTQAGGAAGGSADFINEQVRAGAERRAQAERDAVETIDTRTNIEKVAAQVVLDSANAAKAAADAQKELTAAQNAETIRLRGLARAEESARVAALLPAAGGGFISGPGSGTSDSIAAMVSNGEFIVNAATTRMLGAPFFHGLQSIARRRLSIPRFGVGGLVGAGIPGFEPVVQAAGAGGAPVNIHLPSGDVVRLREGETDSQGVIRLFRREARKRGTRGA